MMACVERAIECAVCESPLVISASFFLLMYAGAISVISPIHTAESVYESGPDYCGTDGLWTLPSSPGGTTHALLLLSFASGSRALATGVRAI